MEPTSKSAVNIQAKSLMQKQCQKKTRDLNKSNPIVVEEIESKIDNSTMWIPELKLSFRDKEILLSSNAWLTDSIIDAAQTLLKRATPVPGLQSVSCALTMTYDVQPGEFVQILNNGRGHWVTVSTIGTVHPNIKVYDSLYSCASSHLKTQIAAVLATEKSHIQLKFMDVPVQSGTSDCGLYAVAFAAALALGEKPEHFYFNQKRMRQHLLQFWRKELWKCFPQAEDKGYFRKSAVKAVEKIEIHCNCRMPEFPSVDMIQCRKCGVRYHLDTCVNVPTIYINSSKSWFCSRCV